ncbi:MAG: diaminopimelate epimerase [Clostridiaceae bacterium]|nr:diaminopimelate epimerase [Clostridiaceae bacterium]
MKLPFTKMQGCGNDYIYIDCFRETVKDPGKLAIKLSDRHFSVGGDGVVLICPSDRADARMRMFNADGSEGRMCGNAIRCVGKYVYEHGYCAKDTLTIDTLSGIKTLRLAVKDGKAVAARVDMGAAGFRPKDIPVLSDGERVVNQPLEVLGRTYHITCVSMGTPHCVSFVEDPQSFPLETVGPVFERHPMFPDRVNAEFARVLDRRTIEMRVWERGSGETLACGTGACATAAAAIACGYCDADTDIDVRLRGGVLTIRVTADTVFMTGPAEVAFEGFVEG